MIKGLCLAACLLTSTASAAAPSPFLLNSQWTLQFRSPAGPGAPRPESLAFTVVSVEQSTGSERGFGLVSGQRKYNALTVLNASDGFLMVADLTVTAAHAGRLRVCAFGTLRPPQRSGLRLLIPSAQLEQTTTALRKRMATLRASEPGASTLTVLRRAAGALADGSTCTIRPLR